MIPAAEAVGRRGAVDRVPRKLKGFERYLTVWVAVCMVAGVAIGRMAPGWMGSLRTLEFGRGSEIEAPIAIVIWLMSLLMTKIDFSAL